MFFFLSFKHAKNIFHSWCSPWIRRFLKRQFEFEIIIKWINYNGHNEWKKRKTEHTKAELFICILPFLIPSWFRPLFNFVCVCGVLRSTVSCKLLLKKHTHLPGNDAKTHLIKTTAVIARELCVNENGWRGRGAGWLVRCLSFAWEMRVALKNQRIKQNACFNVE